MHTYTRTYPQRNIIRARVSSRPGGEVGIIIEADARNFGLQLPASLLAFVVLCRGLRNGRLAVQSVKASLARGSNNLRYFRKYLIFDSTPFPLKYFQLEVSRASQIPSLRLRSRTGDSSIDSPTSSSRDNQSPMSRGEFPGLIHPKNI